MSIDSGGRKAFAQLFLVFFLSISLLDLARAEQSTHIETNQGAFHLHVPKKWTGVHSLYGIPYTLLSPMREGSRLSILITPTGVAVGKGKIRKKDLTRRIASYQRERKEWLDSRSLTLQKFLPYRAPSMAGQSVHALGMEFALPDGTVLRERSYYLPCPENLIHIKVMGTKKEWKSYRSEVQSVMGGFQCEG